MNQQPYGTVAIITGLGSLGAAIFAWPLGVTGIICGIISASSEQAGFRATIGILSGIAGCLYWLLG